MRKNSYNIGNGKYLVFYKKTNNKYNYEKENEFVGVCENFNPNGLSAFWNEEKEQMLLVKYSNITGLYPIE